MNTILIIDLVCIIYVIIIVIIYVNILYIIMYVYNYVPCSKTNICVLHFSVTLKYHVGKLSVLLPRIQKNKNKSNSHNLKKKKSSSIDWRITDNR